MLRYHCVVFNQVYLQLSCRINQIKERIRKRNVSYRLVLLSLREPPVLALGILNLVKSHLPFSQHCCPLIVHNCLFNGPEIVPLTDKTHSKELTLEAGLSPFIVPNRVVHSSSKVITSKGDESRLNLKVGLCHYHVVLNTVDYRDLCQ